MSEANIIDRGDISNSQQCQLSAIDEEEGASDRSSQYSGEIADDQEESSGDEGLPCFGKSKDREWRSLYGDLSFTYGKMV